MWGLSPEITTGKLFPVGVYLSFKVIVAFFFPCNFLICIANSSAFFLLFVLKQSNQPAVTSAMLFPDIWRSFSPIITAHPSLRFSAILFNLQQTDRIKKKIGT